MSDHLAIGDPAAGPALAGFSQPTQQWFRDSFARPTTAQAGAWDAIRQGRHALVVAPTGSGKTLAAFLWAVDTLLRGGDEALDPATRCRVLYVSPLKALASDVQRNLRSPLIGIDAAGQRLGVRLPQLSIAIRSGDTPAQERRVFARRPPDILITTPESLFLLLTSRAGAALAGVQTVILDEVHAVAGTKRGAHLAVSLERLDEMTPTPTQRIGLSATVRPLATVAHFLTGSRRLEDGGRQVSIVAPPSEKAFDLTVQVPVPDMADLGRPSQDSTGQQDLTGNAAGEPARTSIWPAVEERVVDLVAPVPGQPHRSTLVFTNSRRLSERLTARLNEIWAGRLSPPGDDASDGHQSGSGHESAKGHQHAPGPPPAQVMAAAGSAVGAPLTLARAHHGSVSKEQRVLIEDDLKSGRLPAVVATSSLELGIDMGSIDLVVQVESPPTVSSGLQRVGRAGHQVGAVSAGVILPKFRADLLSAAVVTERMRAGAIETLSIPGNPLDVLAQHVVAAVAMRDWGTEELYAMCCRAAPFATLPRPVFDAVLDMLAGRYPSEDFAELRPRVVWDRVNHVVSGRPGAQRLAVTSGGTIPDRGLFGVFLASGQESSARESSARAGRRVGELDEEMVYESRVGDAFTLGASTWQIVDITRDQVLVVPAPGMPGKLPFWHGDAQGRPADLGAAIGAFTRSLDGSGSRHGVEATRRLRELGLDEWAAQNLLRYLEEQREAAGQLPTDTTLVLEKFRDELGDWRVVLHSPFGNQVHQPWALAIAARIRERFGVDAQVMGADNGIVARLPDTAIDAMWAHEADQFCPSQMSPSTDILDVLAELISIEPDEIEGLVTSELGGSSLFAARFRECAARALLLPRRRPDQRQPLWQQRQRAAQLLEVAARFPGFPIVLETMRECLQDVFDVPALVGLLTNLRSGKIRLVEVTTQSASPFASALMFGYVAAFLYEGDSPLAERRSAALALDPQLLAEVLGRADAASLADLLDAKAVVETWEELQWLAPDRQARHAEEMTDLLRALGPLDAQEITARAQADADDISRWLGELMAARRIIPVRIAGVDQYAIVEDAARLRDALGVPMPPGIPAALLESTPGPLESLIQRYARHQVAFTAAELARRFGLGVAVVRQVLLEADTAGRLSSGDLLPAEARRLLGPPQLDGEMDGTQYCDSTVLRLLKRRSLAALRAEVEPVPQQALAAFTPSWQHVVGLASAGEAGSVRDPRRQRSGGVRGVDGLVSVVEQLAGLPVPASALESLVLPNRVRDYSPSMLDELTLAGEVLWVGHRGLPGEDGWISLHPAPTAHLTLPLPGEDPLTDTQERVLAELAGGGAFFFRELSNRVRSTEDAALVDDLWTLVWAGRISGDSLTGLRARLGDGRTAHRTPRSAPRARYAHPRRGALAPGLVAGAAAGGTPPAQGWTQRAGRHMAPTRAGPPSVAGRWAALPIPVAEPTIRLSAWAEILLDRYGIVSRGSVAVENVPGGFARMYRVLSAMEDAGRVRRGYFVDGLGASQFATAGAVDRLRATAEGLSTDRAATSGAHTDQFSTPPAQRPGPGADSPAGAVVLAAADPANPYGAALDWPPSEGGHRPARRAGAVVVLVDGALTLYVERGGRSMMSWRAEPDRLSAAAHALAAAVRTGVLGRLTVSKTDGSSVLTGPGALADALQAAGFVPGPRGFRLSGQVR